MDSSTNILPKYRQFSFVWLVLCIILSYAIKTPSEFNHSIFTIICLVSYCLCVYHWAKCGCKILSLYVLFVFYLGISNLGQSILMLFQVPEELIGIYFKVRFDTLVEMLRFQAVSIAALNYGTVLYVTRPGRSVSLSIQQESYEASVPRISKYDMIVDILLYISLGYYVYTAINMVIIRQTVDYSTFFEMGRGMGKGLLNNIAQYCIIILSIWSLFNKRHIKLIYGCLIFSFLLINYAGARGVSIPLAAVILVTLPVTHKGLFKKKFILPWIAVFLVLFSMMSIISSTRMDLLDGSSLNVSNGIAYSAMSTMAEMGSAARPATLSIEAVNSGYFLQPTILVTLIRAFIPFSSNLSFIQDAHINLSQWVTDYANNGNSGLGFSCIGELYVNFGHVGWLFMIFWGSFIAYAENKAYYEIFVNKKYLYAVALLAILVVLVPWARGEFSRSLGCWRYGFYLLILKAILNK